MDVLAGWSDFHVAMVGATAALAGLVIVAASVNIGDIVKEASLVARLAAGIASLVLALAMSAIALIPALAPVPLGAAGMVLAVVAGAFAVVAARRIAENTHPENRMRPLKAALGFLAPLAYLVGGALVLVGAEAAGLALFAVGAIVAIVAALVVSWIVLVEVLR
jgi:hypothetical protein